MAWSIELHASNRAFCIEWSSLLCDSCLSGFNPSLFNIGYTIMPTISPLNTRRCRLCRGPSINNIYKLELHGIISNPFKYDPHAKVTGNLAYSSHVPVPSGDPFDFLVHFVPLSLHLSPLGMYCCFCPLYLIGLSTPKMPNIIIRRKTVHAWSRIINPVQNSVHVFGLRDIAAGQQ